MVKQGRERGGCEPRDWDSLMEDRGKYLDIEMLVTLDAEICFFFQ